MNSKDIFRINFIFTQIKKNNMMRFKIAAVIWFTMTAMVFFTLPFYSNVTMTSSQIGISWYLSFVSFALSLVFYKASKT